MIKDTSSQDVILNSKSAKGLWLKIGLPLIAIIGLVAIAYPSFAQWSDTDIAVNASRLRLAKVERGTFIKDIAVQGNIVAANSPKLYAPAIGTVTLIANPGKQVKKGELIAEINSPELTNQLQQEESQLASLAIALERKKIESKQAQIKSRQQIQLEKVVLDAAKREMRRAEESIKLQAISQLDYEKAIDDLKRAELKYQFSVEQFELEKENLAFELKTLEFEQNQFKLQVDNTARLVSELKILAPVTGIVGAWYVDQKAAVALNQALLAVVDLSAFQVEIDIPESYADELGIGMLANITYNQQQYQANIISISPEVTNNVVKGRLAFSAEPPPGIKQNQRISGRVIIEQKENILFVPRGSFVQHHGGRKAFVINDNVAHLTDIKLGTNSVNQIEVVSGLSEGEEIIISNTDFVDKAETLLIKN